ncbi:MAG: hypothetical protein WAX69_24930 [Victivallales bacterium]
MKPTNQQTSFKLSLQGMALVNSSQAITMNRGFSFESKDGVAGIYREIVSSKSIPLMRLDNFRRAGEKARLAMLGSMLALADAGSSTGGSTAIIGWGGEESMTENRAYFTDYAVNGRFLGRSQLFIGTLPSTPLCEAAICLNLHGPVYYFQSDGGLNAVLAEAESLLSSQPAGQALLLGISSGELLALLLEQSGDKHDFSQLMQIEDMSGIYHHLKEKFSGTENLNRQSTISAGRNT